MKLSTLGVAGISTLVGLVFMSAVMAAEPDDGDRRPAFQGGRGPGPGGAGGGRGGFRRGPALERQLERMDTNEDDQVSEDEFVDFRLARVDKMFERRDRDDDGLISLEENERPDRPDRPNRPDRPEIDREEVIACVRETIADFAPNADMDMEERFENVDTDGNGSLSLAEVSTALESRAHEAFAKIDADASGFITEEELKAHRRAQFETSRVVRECAREAAQA